MKKIFFIMTMIMALFKQGECQESIDTKLITDSLKKNADAVIRYYLTEYERESVEKYSLNVKYVVTVLNEEGISAAKMMIHYDRNSEVDKIEGNIYNGSGKLVKQIKKKDIRDYAYNNSYTLFSDHRVKHFQPNSNVYPFTVEYTYKINYKGVVGFSNWIPQRSFNVSAENVQLIFKSAEEMDIKHKELNYDFIFKANTTEDGKSYKWEANNLIAIPDESNNPGYLEIFPAVILSPFQISYEGTNGEISSWKSYGKWVYNLIKDRDKISDETITKLKLLTDTIDDRKQKIEAVYQYMQSKTRYVNIALGIGGFQPINAEDVDEKGYGDCKALSNYMKSLLKNIGIESFYTEIGNGKNQKISFIDFPSANQTNHVILCVPIENDTIWLECTSQNMPFGYIGSSNSDRYALLIKEDGGCLVKTTKYDTQDNIRSSKIQIDLDELGNASLKINTSFKNYLFEDIFYMTIKSNKEQKETLLKTITAERLLIDDFSIEDNSDKIASAKFEMSGKISKYALKSASRFFVKPNFIFENSFVNSISSNRKTNLYQSVGYTYQDSISINIPKSAKIEHIPKDFQTTSEYGTYQIKYQQPETNEVLITRTIQINEGNYDKRLFEEINSFLLQISKHDNAKLILKNT